MLVVAIIFAFGAMAVSAATARGYACDSCGSSNTKLEIYYVHSHKIPVAYCDKVNSSHYHTVQDQYRKIKCRDCAAVVSFATGKTREVCV